jgi:lactam utilization protein B
LTLHADTICVHGDRPDAALFARRLHEALSGKMESGSPDA